MKKYIYNMEYHKTPTKKSYYFITIIALLCLGWIADHDHQSKQIAEAQKLECKQQDLTAHDSAIMSATCDTTVAVMIRLVGYTPCNKEGNANVAAIIRTLKTEGIRPKVMEVSKN